MAGVLLLGGAGRLGSAWRPTLAVCDAPPSQAVDLCDDDALAQKLDETEPELVINCAGMTDVDQCERDPQRADELNGYAPGRLASQCARHGVAMLHVSTDYVFSGHEQRALTEEEPLNPVNRYGQSKARGEGLVLDSGAEALVARVQWLFGGQKNDFVRFVRGRLLAGQPVPIVSDQTGVPSYTEDLVAQLNCAWGTGRRGVIHCANTGSVSRLEQAEVIARHLKVDPAFEMVTWAELGRPACRPERSVLDTTLMAALMAAMNSASDLPANDVIPAWYDAQERYLDALAKEDS
jgi:dTDP-4-dehydrorhamnose reductase